MLLCLLGGGPCDPACSGLLTLSSQDHMASVTCSLYFQIPSMHSWYQVYTQTLSFSYFYASTAMYPLIITSSGSFSYLEPIHEVKQHLY